LPIASGRNLSIDNFSQDLSVYLTGIGLPAENILVPVSERMKVIKNIPDIAAELNASQLARAVYISKFVAACAAGLFDAALNFLWNETVSNLREKVAQFDLDYFFDSVVTDLKRRSRLRTADDLKELDDWELVKGCLTTGIISDLGFRHLDYIRSMRNHASAAHPNQNQLTGLQVVSWLETCQKEVLSKDPTGPVLEVKRLLNNIRTKTFTQSDILPIEPALIRLPEDILASFSRTLFGMYSDPALASNARNNVLLVAPVLWRNATDNIRHSAGLYYATLAANGDVDKTKLIRQLLDTVGGLAYLPSDNRAVEIHSCIQRLWISHNGYNNFHYEEPHARALQKFVPASGEVPISIEISYLKTLVMCRIGNGYGVARSAIDVYDDLILRLTPKQVALILMIHIKDFEFQARLQLVDCLKNFQHLMGAIAGRIRDPQLGSVLNQVSQVPIGSLGALANDLTYQQSVESLNRLYK